MVLSIKTIIISTCIALIVGSASTFYITYNYQENKYERIIADEHKAQQLAVRQEAEKALRNERAAAQTIREIESKYTDTLAALNSVQGSFDQLRAQYGGLYIRVKSCQDNAGTSNSTSAGASEGASDPEQWAELSRATAEQLEEIAREADELRSLALLAKEYAEAVEAQRERMMKNEYARD